MFSFGSISSSARLWFVLISECLYLAPQCFYCTTLRDVILAERCSASVMSRTCILQHAVVCWVTAAGIRANALTLGWKPIKWVEHVGSLIIIVKSFLEVWWIFT
jgi:hypothetical protein